MSRLDEIRDNVAAAEAEGWYGCDEDARADIRFLLYALDDARAALRAIALGNLGGDPWQADYRRIAEFASAALHEGDGTA